MNRSSKTSLDWSGYLPRMPKHHWEGWFFIGIGRATDTVRWVKHTVFRSRRATPLAALEGLTEPGRAETLVGLGDRIVAAATPFAPDALSADAAAFHVSLGETIDLRAEQAAVRAAARHVAPAVSTALRVHPADRLSWIRLAPLTYFGYHGALTGEVSLDGARHPLAGLGVVEHAWGASVPFDASRLVRGPWHWDVLRFDADDSAAPPPSAAALWIPVPGVGAVGVRGFARLPGAPFGAARPRAIEYMQTTRLGATVYPLRWRARLETSSGALDYEAEASTPLSPSAPKGGFLGFRFSGHLSGAAGPVREVRGTGFTECGGTD